MKDHVQGSALALALALAASVPAPAPATHGPGCGTSDPRRITSASCTFLMKGLPVSVYGTVSAPGESVTLRIWVTSIREENLASDLAERGVDHDPQVLVECRASRSGSAACDSDLGVGETVDAGQVSAEALRCRVRVTPAGASVTYWCQSGRGF